MQPYESLNFDNGENIPDHHEIRALGVEPQASTTPDLDVMKLFGTARLALQAYKKPVHGKVDVDRDSTGTCTQYVSKAFARNIFSRLLRVEVNTVLQGGNQKTLRVEVSVEQSVALPTHNHANYRRKGKEEPHSAVLCIRKGTSSPTINIRILAETWPCWGKADPDAAALAEGKLKLPEDWSASQQTKKFEVELQPSSKQLGSFSVELAVAVLPIETLQEAQWPIANGEDVDIKVAEVAEALADLLPSQEHEQHSPGVHKGHPLFSRIPEDPLLEDSVPSPSQGRQALRPNAKEPSEVRRRVAAADEAVGEFSFMHGAECVAFVDNPHSHTQAVVFVNSSLKQVGVAMRGTDVFELKDWLTNFSTAKATFSEDARPFGLAMPPSTQESDGSHPEVHSGFLRAWRSVQPAVERILQDCTQGHRGWSVMFTGHSLGASVATIAAASVAMNGAAEGSSVGCYSFGSPRVGNGAFARLLAAHVTHSWRVFQYSDVLAKVPNFGYVPVTNGLRISRADAGHLRLLTFVDARPSSLHLGPVSVPLEVLGDLVERPEERSGWLEGLRKAGGVAWEVVTLQGLRRHEITEYFESFSTLVGSVRGRTRWRNSVEAISEGRRLRPPTVGCMPLPRSKPMMIRQRGLSCRAVQRHGGRVQVLKV